MKCLRFSSECCVRRQSPSFSRLFKSTGAKSLRKAAMNAAPLSIFPVKRSESLALTSSAAGTTWVRRTSGLTMFKKQNDSSRSTNFSDDWRSLKPANLGGSSRTNLCVPVTVAEAPWGEATTLEVAPGCDSMGAANKSYHTSVAACSSCSAEPSVPRSTSWMKSVTCAFILFPDKPSLVRV